MVDIEKYIDHTLLRPDSVSKDIEKLCSEANLHGFHTVFVLPCWVSFASQLLQESSVKVGSVAGFPLGGSVPEIKAAEAARVIDDGADEVDMVMNIGAAKEGNWSLIHQEIEQVVQASNGRGVKVILETCLLSDDEIRFACHVSVDAGAAFVKTSTGFSTTGATVEAVQIMREAVGPECGVKASGGIRTREFALALIEAGATRIGTSCGTLLLKSSMNVQ